MFPQSWCGQQAAVRAGNELFVIPGNPEGSEGRAGAASLAVAPHPLPPSILSRIVGQEGQKGQSRAQLERC